MYSIQLVGLFMILLSRGSVFQIVLPLHESRGRQCMYVCNTHLQADGHPTTRMLQLSELTAFLGDFVQVDEPMNHFGLRTKTSAHSLRFRIL